MRWFFIVLFLFLVLGGGLWTGYRSFSFDKLPPSSRESFSLEYDAERALGTARNRLLPFTYESRAAAAEFNPVKKLATDNLAVTSAHAAVIMDVDTGAVLFESAGYEKRQIASLTKIMTAVIVAERVADLDQPVSIDEEAVYADGTRVGCPRSGYCNGERLRIGEKVTVRDLLKAALMNSANDAAIALGKFVGGTQEGFAKIMNERAVEMGLKHSHFCTPSGLEPEGREAQCYSSAYDIARITSQALRYPVLWEIMRLPEATITSVDGKYSHEIFNTDALLGEYPNLLGTKTGFTPLAGYSLLAVAFDPSGKHRIVSVVLDDPTRWQDIQTMFAWAFRTHAWE